MATLTVKMNLTFADENTDLSAMRSADEALCYCFTMARRDAPDLIPLIKEAQRRLRRRTNPEMFTAEGEYR